MRLAVAVARIGLDAEQVVPGQLGLDPFEERRLSGCHGEQRPARRAGQQLESFAARPAVANRIDRQAAIGQVEHLVVQSERVHARPRFGGQTSQIDDHRLVAEHEPFRDQNQRLRRIDRAQADQQIAQSLNRPVGLAVRVARERQRFHQHFGSAQFEL